MMAMALLDMELLGYCDRDGAANGNCARAPQDTSIKVRASESVLESTRVSERDRVGHFFVNH